MYGFFFCREFRCPTNGWRGTCPSVPNVLSVIKPAGACFVCRTGGASGAKLRYESAEHSKDGDVQHDKNLLGEL